MYIRELISGINDRNLYIWGANDVGAKASELLIRSGFRDHEFIDSFRKGQFDGKRIYEYEEIRDLHPFIVVAVRNYECIEERLKKDGFRCFSDYVCLNRCVELVNPSHYRDLYGNAVVGDGLNAVCVLSMHGEISIGQDVCFGRDVRITCGVFSSLRIGDGCRIGDNARIEVGSFSELILGDNCILKEDASIKCTDHSSAVFLEDVIIGRRNEVWLSKNGRLSIGRGSGFDENLIARVYNGSSVVIGDDCMFSYDIRIRGDQGHAIIIDGEKINHKNVTFGNHIWVGMGCIIAPGADIGDNSMIGAASFVNSKLTGGCMYAGTPAKEKKTISTWTRDP